MESTSSACSMRPWQSNGDAFLPWLVSPSTFPSAGKAVSSQARFPQRYAPIGWENSPSTMDHEDDHADFAQNPKSMMILWTLPTSFQTGEATAKTTWGRPSISRILPCLTPHTREPAIPATLANPPKLVATVWLVGALTRANLPDFANLPWLRKLQKRKKQHLDPVTRAIHCQAHPLIDGTKRDALAVVNFLSSFSSISTLFYRGQVISTALSTYNPNCLVPSFPLILSILHTLASSVSSHLFFSFLWN